MSNDSPRTCVACILENEEGKILIGKRKVDNLIGFPGGKQNKGETIITALFREVREETSLFITKFRKIENAEYVESILPSGEHYIVFFFVATEWGGILRNAEKDKCYGWNWIDKKDIFNNGQTLDSIVKFHELAPHYFGI